MPTGQRKGINSQRLSECGGCHLLPPNTLHAPSSPKRNLISPQCHLKAGSAFSPISPPPLYFRWRHVVSVSVALLKSSAGLLAPGRYTGDNGDDHKKVNSLRSFPPGSWRSGAGRAMWWTSWGDDEKRWGIALWTSMFQSEACKKRDMTPKPRMEVGKGVPTMLCTLSLFQSPSAFLIHFPYPEEQTKKACVCVWSAYAREMTWLAQGF